MKDKIIEILKDHALLRTDGVHSVYIRGVYPELFEKVADYIDSLYKWRDNAGKKPVSEEGIEEYNESRKFITDAHMAGQTFEGSKHPSYSAAFGYFKELNK